jgi:hypothetical protein
METHHPNTLKIQTGRDTESDMLKIKFNQLIVLATLITGISVGVILFTKEKREPFNNYHDFLSTFYLDVPNPPSISVWIKESYGSFDEKNLLQVLTMHCDDESVLLETRNVSCRAISTAHQMKMYLSSDELSKYLLRAKIDCLDEDAHACSAILHSMMLMEGVYVADYSSIYKSFLEEFIVLNHTREHPKPYCFTELRAALEHLNFESSFKEFCGEVDNDYSNKNVRGYKALIVSLNNH